MGQIYVARSVKLSKWGSDVGVSKHVFKLGVAEEGTTPKDLAAAGWAGESDWAIVKQQDAGAVTEEEAIGRLTVKDRMLDPTLYPKLKGARGFFKVLPAHVENHILVSRALAGDQRSEELKLKPADFAAYLIHNALR
jgi:hypothetical protein